MPRAFYQGDLLWKLLAFCGVIAPVIVITLIFVGAAVTSGYNHISEPISQLAAEGSTHPGWMTAGFITYGIMIIGFGWALYRSAETHRLAWLVLLFYILHGIGFLFGGVFSDDARAVETVSTTSGILHNVSIIIGCSSFIIGTFAFIWIKYKDPKWRLLTRIFIILLVIILLTFIISQIPFLADAEGLMQRIYGFLAIVLIEMAAIKILISLKHSQIDSGILLSS